jgi:hypothetical protein
MLVKEFICAKISNNLISSRKIIKKFAVLLFLIFYEFYNFSQVNEFKIYSSFIDKKANKFMKHLYKEKDIVSCMVVD